MAALSWRHLEIVGGWNTLHSWDKLVKPKYQPGRCRSAVRRTNSSAQHSSGQWAFFVQAIQFRQGLEFFSRNLWLWYIFHNRNTFWKVMYLFPLVVWFKYIADWWQSTFTSPSWHPKNKSKKPLIFLVCSIQNYTG